MNKSESITKLAAALSKAQSQITGALKDSKNSFFNSKYADLESVWEACRKPLADNELSVSQVFSGESLTTILMHSSGEWISGDCPLFMKSKDPQQLGSASTYARRYGLAAIVGVIQVDDDANLASRGTNQEAAQEKAQRVQQEVSKKLETPFDSPINNDHPLSNYVLPEQAKKYAGKALGSIPANELKGYYQHMIEWYQKEGKQPRGIWQEILGNIETYLGIK